MTQSDRRGATMILAVFVTLAAIVLFRVQKGDAPKPDENQCVGDVAASTVIIVDHTEKTTVQTRTEIVQRALAYVNGRKTNERVAVFHVNSTARKSLLPTFVKCKPPHPDEVSRMTGSRSRAEKRFRDFTSQLRASLSVIPVDSEESPLAQAFIDLSLSQYLRTEENSLLIFSDLLENTAGLRIYNCDSGQTAIRKFRDARQGAVERPKFKNTRVLLHVIPRFDLARESVQCRDYFWNWFFGDNEGALASVEVDPLPGGDAR